MVKNDLDASKAFIAANIDIIPSKLFLRALTAEKLSVQSRKNTDQVKLLNFFLFFWFSVTCPIASIL